MGRIQLLCSDGDRGIARLRINAKSFFGHAGLADQSAQVDLDGTQYGELEVEEGDDVAVPQRVQPRRSP